jgi:hypothetical protein
LAATANHGSIVNRSPGKESAAYIAAAADFIFLPFPKFMPYRL